MYAFSYELLLFSTTHSGVRRHTDQHLNVPAHMYIHVVLQLALNAGYDGVSSGHCRYKNSMVIITKTSYISTQNLMYWKFLHDRRGDTFLLILESDS